MIVELNHLQRAGATKGCVTPSALIKVQLYSQIRTTFPEKQGLPAAKLVHRVCRHEDLPALSQAVCYLCRRALMPHT